MVDLLNIEFWATVSAITAPVLAFTIYFHRRYVRRKHLATALMEEIKQNRYWANSMQPHYTQHGIVSSDEKYQYPYQNFSSHEEWVKTISQGIPMPRQVITTEYDAGDIPPSARASSRVYESMAAEISRFDTELAKEIVSYYHFLDFVKELNDVIHEGRELPPAAYSVLVYTMDEHIVENEDIIRELQIEVRRFPRLYRYFVLIREYTAVLKDRVPSTPEFGNRDSDTK